MHTHNRFTALLDFVSHPLSASSITIHCILPLQFTCLTVFFHNLSPPSLIWSTSWPGTLNFILHTFLHPLSSFHSTCPYHRNLFCCITQIMSSNLSLNRLLRSLACSLTPHIHLTTHLCPLKCHLIFLSYGPILTWAYSEDDRTKTNEYSY